MPDAGISLKRPHKAADPCHKATGRASAGRAMDGPMSEPPRVGRANCGPIRFRISQPSACSALNGLIMASEFGYFAGGAALAGLRENGP